MARPRLIAAVHPTERLIGQAPAIVALRAHIQHLATFDAIGNPFVPTVLLQGETGTGKGLVARIIHDSGPRAPGPFLEVNCAAIPDSLLEAELFGFEAGAFTDAKRAKPGLLEAASGGTLFLDEIDALPLTLQGKLLTVLDAKRVRRLGAIVEHLIDVKLTVATQADLRARIAEGRFRTDLYHRLAVILLEVPPLRKRGADMVLLAQHYLQRAAEAYRLSPKRLDPQAELWLQRYTWLGNVRELAHLMERVTLLCPDPLIGLEMLEQLCVPLSKLSPPVSTSPPEADTEAADEAAQIRHALQQTAGNVARAARLLGMSRGAFRHRMARYRIAPSSQGGQMGVALPQERPGRRMRPAVPQNDGETVPLSRAALAPTQSWEQKPVAVLAVEVTWPAHNEGEASPYEPWTVTSRWEQMIIQKVQGFGGVVLPHAPSSVMVAFGVPQVLEQAPQRAIQAALALRRMLTETEDGGPSPELRMAVHWGQVLMDTGVIDPTTRLLPIADALARPGRLVGYAEPGEILVSPEIGRLVGGWYELCAREKLLGIGQPDQISAYSVIGLGPLDSPLQPHGQRPLSRFVGRERELAVLDDLLQRVRGGRGQVVGVIGEPGVGKSRLCYEFIRAHHTHSWLNLETSAASYGKATPYLPLIDLLKAYFQLQAGDDLQTRRAKVTDKLLALEPALQPILPALLVLLDVPVEDLQWQALDPSQRRRRLMDAVKQLMLRESQVQPLLLIVENLHWIDGETQALLDSIVESLPAARVLLLVSYRPEYQHNWGSKTYYTQLRIDPLPPESAQEFAHSILGHHASLVPLTECLIELTEGNPFFLEESIQTLVETQALTGDRGAYRLVKVLPRMQVPATVHMVLAARIDRLPGEDKRLLQDAAVIGKEVPFSLLQAVVEQPAEVLHQGLVHLQRAEFLYERSLWPDLAYTFKHALTHEVAYESLQPEQRRALHARIVDAVETLEADRLAAPVDRLAHHALRGEVWDKAFTYYRQAADNAMGRSAYREVIISCEQALVALRHLPAEGDALAQGVDLLRELYNALVQFGEFGRGLDYLREAETLANELGDHRRLGQILTSMTHSFWTVGDYDHAIACGQRALALTAASGDIVHQAMVQGYLGTVYFYLGDYRRAIDVLRQALTAFEGEWRHERFGMSMLHSVRVRTWLMDCLRELGDFAEGRACGEEAVRIAEAAGHVGSTLMPEERLGSLALVQGDLPHAISLLEHALAQCHAAHVPLYVPAITACLGLAYALSGRSAEALALIEQLQIRETPGMGGSAQMLRLGEAYLWIGSPNDAFPLVERALRLSSGRKERGSQARALRLLGEIAAQRDPPEVAPAEDYFRQALAKAEDLGMRPLQAHCHFGLGTLYAKIGREESTRAELSTAIELYRAMDMAFWLPQAEAALERTR